MKLVAIAAAATFAAVASAETCDISALEPLMTDTDTQTCVADSGVAVESMNNLTDAEMDILCTDAACQSFVAKMKELAPSECTMGSFSLYAGFITPLEEYCANSSSSGSLAATVGSTTGSSSAATVTASATGSVESSATTTSASKSGSSGASSAAVSIGVVVAAVAVAFF